MQAWQKAMTLRQAGSVLGKHMTEKKRLASRENVKIALKAKLEKCRQKRMELSYENKSE